MVEFCVGLLPGVWFCGPQRNWFANEKQTGSLKSPALILLMMGVQLQQAR